MLTIIFTCEAGLPALLTKGAIMEKLDLPITTKLAGVVFGDCQQNIRIYAHLYSSMRMEREPLNKFDPNAISVKANGYHIGYIPRDLAADVAPVLDNDPGSIKILFIRRNVSEKAIVKTGGEVVRGVTVKIVKNGKEK
jgi:hypothetical protein